MPSGQIVGIIITSESERPGIVDKPRSLPFIIDDMLQNIRCFTTLPITDGTRHYYLAEILKCDFIELVGNYSLEELKYVLDSYDNITLYYTNAILTYRPLLNPEILVLFKFTIIHYINRLIMVAEVGHIDEFDQLAQLVFNGILIYDGDFIPDLIDYIINNEKLPFQDIVLNKLYSYIIPTKSSSSIGKPISDTRTQD